MGASESKLAFKEDIFRLAGEDNIPLDSAWWSRFLQLPESPEDVQALWSPSDLRSLTHTTPADRPPSAAHASPKKNVETLLYRTISRLHLLQSRRVYDDPHASIAPEVLNGVRILTRLLPYIYEADHLADWEDDFFWQPRRPASYPNPKSNGCIYIDGLNGKLISAERKNSTIGPPLGEQLINILIDFLFFPGLTLPSRDGADGLPELKPVYTVWQSGIGANKGVGMTKENERNAVEILRLLLVLAGRSMYSAPNVIAEKDIRPLTYLTTQADRAVVLNTICSLLNTVLKYNQNPWTFSMDLGGATRDSKQPLVTCSFHFLLVLITYPVPNNSSNEFRKAVGRLHRAEDFQFIVEGLRQILMPPTSGMLRPVQRLTSTQPPMAADTLALFWELLQCNKRFRSYLIDTDRARDFVVLVLYYAIEAKDDPARQSVVRICVFILQTLSVEERFGPKLNVPLAGQETLPGPLQIPNFHGSYADFLIGHIHTLLTSGNRGLESLHPALLAVVNNIAPYVQNLQRATSSMLMNLFVSLSQPSFLLANENNNVLLFSLLDAMNAILEHRYEDNRRFVSVIIKGRKRFEALRDFTVEGAEAEIDRLAMERKDAGEPLGLRTASQDSTRSPISTRAPSLDDVPEDSAFAIGDEDDEENDSNADSHGMPAMRLGSSAVEEDSVPVQSRNMSEKARGKQPIGQGNFSRSTSRNTSNTSLPSLIRLPTRTSQQPFSPDYQWLHTWLPHLPLHTILQTIDNAEHSDLTTVRAGETAALTATVPAATSKHSGTIRPGDPSAPKEVKVQTFRWTNLALGWYISLVWGRIYAADSARTWVGTNIRLFNVIPQQSRISLSSPKGAVDAVGDSIARRIGSPFAGMMCADFGATVLRVDRASTGVAPPTADQLVRRKSSICVNTKKAEGVELLKTMIPSVDILIEPFRPGVMEKMGLGPDVLLKLNPRLIYARMTGFRRDGKYASMAGHDINYIAVSGVLSMLGRKDDKPYPPGNILGDFAGGGLVCFLGIVLAIFHRIRTGHGQVVEANMVDGSAYLATMLRLATKGPSWNAPRGTNMLDGGAPYYTTYETKDGGYMAVGALEPQFYAALLKGLGIAESSIAGNRLDKKTWAKQEEMFTEKFKTKTRDEWERIFDGTDACCTPILLQKELEERGFDQRPIVTLKSTPALAIHEADADNRPPAEGQGIGHEGSGWSEKGLKPGSGGEEVLAQWMGWKKGRHYLEKEGGLEYAETRSRPKI